MSKYIVVDNDAYCLDSRGITHCLPNWKPHLVWDEDNLRVLVEEDNQLYQLPYREITKEDYKLFVRLYTEVQRNRDMFLAEKSKCRDLGSRLRELEDD